MDAEHTVAVLKERLAAVATCNPHRIERLARESTQHDLRNAKLLRKRCDLNRTCARLSKRRQQSIDGLA